MFKEMRRTDRQIAQEEITQILDKAEYGVLSTIGVNGYPYGVPVNFVMSDGKICFHCAAGVGSKVENIKKNPKVCFTTVSDTEVLPDKFATKYESVVAFGEAREVSDETKRIVLEKLIGKYSKGFEESGAKYIEQMFDKTAIFEITVDHMTGKARR